MLGPPTSLHVGPVGPFVVHFILIEFEPNVHLEMKDKRDADTTLLYHEVSGEVEITSHLRCLRSIPISTNVSFQWESPISSSMTQTQPKPSFANYTLLK